MKKPQQNSKKEELTNILKLLTKRIEEATVDIHNIKGNVAGLSLTLDIVKMDTKIIKSDVEKLRSETEEIKDDLKETESRLNKRITHVGDLITMNFYKKIVGLDKRVTRLEHPNLAA